MIDLLDLGNLTLFADDSITIDASLIGNGPGPLTLITQTLIVNAAISELLNAQFLPADPNAAWSVLIDPGIGNDVFIGSPNPPGVRAPAPATLLLPPRSPGTRTGDTPAAGARSARHTPVDGTSHPRQPQHCRGLTKAPPDARRCSCIPQRSLHAAAVVTTT